MKLAAPVQQVQGPSNQVDKTSGLNALTDLKGSFSF